MIWMENGMGMGGGKGQVVEVYGIDTVHEGSTDSQNIYENRGGLL